MSSLLAAGREAEPGRSGPGCLCSRRIDGGLLLGGLGAGKAAAGRHRSAPEPSGPAWGAAQRGRQRGPRSSAAMPRRRRSTRSYASTSSVPRTLPGRARRPATPAPRRAGAARLPLRISELRRSAAPPLRRAPPADVGGGGAALPQVQRPPPPRRHSHGPARGAQGPSVSGPLRRAPTPRTRPTRA